MKMWRECTVAAAVVLSFAWSTAGAEVRTWESRAGATLEAEYAGQEDGVVSLRTAAGKTLQIRLNALSAECQGTIAGIEAARKRQAMASITPLDKLTKVIPATYVASNQEVIGKYEHRNFDAVIYSPSGEMDIFIKENGKYLSHPLRVKLNVWYHDKAKSQWPARKLTGLATEPIYKKGKVLFKQNLEDGVYAETYFALVDNRVQIGYMVKDPPRISIPSNHRIQVDVPAVFKENKDDEADDLLYSPRFEGGHTPERAAAAVSDFFVTVDVKGEKKTSECFSYSKGIDKFPYPLSGAQIEGTYGPRSIDMEIPKKAGFMQGYIYPGYGLYIGYGLMYTKDGARSPATGKSKMLSISIQ